MVDLYEYDLPTLLNTKPAVESTHYTTARIVLVGDSGVGKTGLGWRLAHNEYKEHSSTHGQQFWVLDELSTTKEGTRREAVLWDLAGQPDYRMVHPLFLDKADLSLLVFDATKRDDALASVEYWRKALDRGDGKCGPALLVAARSDRGAPTLTQAELDRFCAERGITGGFLSTSALTGDGLDTLRQRLVDLLPWDRMATTVTTVTFKRIKDFVLKLKEQPDSPLLLTWAELRTHLESSASFTDGELQTAVGHLESHGYVAILRGSEGREHVLLKPELLANLAASIVLEARRDPRGFGTLEEGRLLHRGYALPEIADLTADDAEILLDAGARLFLERNLCFRETLGVTTWLVFPGLINERKPKLDLATPVEDAAYVVSGAVENVYASLVVLLGYTNTFTRTHQWQDQARYEFHTGEVCGFRQLSDRAGEVELVLVYGDDVAAPTRLLFEGLFQRFLARPELTVTRYPAVTCGECRTRQERATVRKRVQAAKGFIVCEECGERISLPKSGEPVSTRRTPKVDAAAEIARRRTAYETAITSLKGLLRDRGPAEAPTAFVSYAWGEKAHERWVARLATDLRNASVLVLLDQTDNAAIGASIGRFVERLAACDFVLAVGTPAYRVKTANRHSEAGSVVAAELDLLFNRLLGSEADKATVLPLLVHGDARTALPVALERRVHADFRREDAYFATLFDLLLTLHRVPVDHPGIADLRVQLRFEDERY